MLEGSKVTKYFGGLVALKNVDFTIRDKEIVGLIGPNGAGKTTLFNCISGIYRPTSGEIRFLNRDITHLKPHEICKLGVGLLKLLLCVPQPFDQLRSARIAFLALLPRESSPRPSR